MRNKGFTMVELVVVMAIVGILTAMLLPAVNRARKKAAINKAQAEMAALASTGGMIYLDVGYYVPLEVYTLTDANIDLATTPQYPVRYTKSGDTPAPPTGMEDFTTMLASESAAPYTADAAGRDAFRDVWDGPYTTWQDSQIYSSTNGVSLLTPEADVTGWDITPAGPPPDDADDARYGAPLDPWNHPYVLAYSTAEEVMVIYSAGPDGKFQTEAGAIKVGDADLVPATIEHTDSDDLLYKFK